MGRGEKKTILIVEDEPQNRKLFRDVLEFHGYATIEAADGRRGIEMANQLAPDLILMDMGLPGMNGIEATRILVGAEATRRIPIVAITAFAMPGDKEKILEAGCRDYIAKPIHIPDLLNKVAEYLGSEPSPVADGENHG